MDEDSDFLEIPVRDDATEFVTFERGPTTISCLASIGVDVAGKHVLDLGAGFGSLSIAAAKAGASSVLAVDVHRDRLIAVQERAIASGVNVRTGEVNLLHPWAGDTNAEIALLMGVVEYAGLWNLSREVVELQRTVLETAYASLGTGGRLVLGTKNRAWPPFALRDAHTRQPLVNILPRGIADKLSEAEFGRPYRHHIHTPRGWARLLRSVGFTDASIYVPYFSYQTPVRIVDHPRFRDIGELRTSTYGGDEQRATRGRAASAKALFMAVGDALHIPLSHSTIIVATK